MIFCVCQLFWVNLIYCEKIWPGCRSRSSTMVVGESLAAKIQVCHRSNTKVSHIVRFRCFMPSDVFPNNSNYVLGNAWQPLNRPPLRHYANPSVQVDWFAVDIFKKFQHPVWRRNTTNTLISLQTRQFCIICHSVMPSIFSLYIPS